MFLAKFQTNTAKRIGWHFVTVQVEYDPKAIPSRTNKACFLVKKDKTEVRPTNQQQLKVAEGNDQQNI